MIGDKKIIEKKCEELGFKLLDENFDYEKNRDSKFEVICLKCGKKSTKSFVTLVKQKCGCKFCKKKNHNYHNSLEEVLPLIYNVCEKNNYTFLGFVGGKWEKCRTTKLLLKCNFCNKITEKNYDNFINKNSGCICRRIEITKNKNKLSLNEVENTIKKSCESCDVEFICFENIDNKYHNNRDKLKFKCKKCGAIFNRLFYDIRHCQIVCDCTKKSFLENMTKKILDDNKINNIYQKTFVWLKYKTNLKLDFYLPDYNTAIECQGIQHFKPIEYFGGDTSFKKQVERDKVKMELCEKHGVKLIYVLNENDINNLLFELKKIKY